jgi:hypothetical protein
MGKHGSYVLLLFGAHGWTLESPSSLCRRITAGSSPSSYDYFMMSPPRASMNDLDRGTGVTLAGIRIVIAQPPSEHLFTSAL